MRRCARSHPRSNSGGTKASVVFNANGPVAGRVRPAHLVRRSQCVVLNQPHSGVRKHTLGAQVLLPLRPQEALRGQIGGDDPKVNAFTSDPEARPDRRGRRARAWRVRGARETDHIPLRLGPVCAAEPAFVSGL